MTGAERQRLVLDLAAELGFHRVGVAAADCERHYDAYLAWVAAGMHGEMAYMAEDDLVAARANCEAIAIGARSIICVALAYSPLEPEAGPDRGRVAKYARAADYHKVIKEKLRALSAKLAIATGEVFVGRGVSDTAPLLERAVAERAGLGFVGKNTMLISPGLGSYTLLGELLTTAEIAPTSVDDKQHCGECTACLDACPTRAFPAPFVLDATRCISYLTIEYRGVVEPELRDKIGDHVFGCDICQDVCPYNAAAPHRSPSAPELSTDDLDAARPRLADLLTLRSSGWKRLVKGRALSRASRRQLIANAAIAAGNSGLAEHIGPLTAALVKGGSEVITEHIAWALVAIARAHANRRETHPGGVEIRAYADSDWKALCDIHDLARVLELDLSGLVAAFLNLEMTAIPEGLFDGELRVAVCGDRVVGFVATADSAVNWLYVHPSWHGNGIGRALLRDAITRGSKAIEIEVLAENEPAISLYKSEGFEVVEERSGKLQGNEFFPARGLRLVRNPH